MAASRRGHDNTVNDQSGSDLVWTASHACEHHPDHNLIKLSGTNYNMYHQISHDQERSMIYTVDHIANHFGEHSTPMHFLPVHVHFTKQILVRNYLINWLYCGFQISGSGLARV